MTIELPEIKGYSEADYEVANAFVNSLFHNFCNNTGSTSLPYWMDKFSNHNEANKMVYRLAQDGWIITTVPKTNWAEVIINKTKLLEEYTQSELNELIIETKLSKYAPTTSKPKSTLEGSTDVKLPSGINKTGLIRRGFAKASKHEFTYDITMMKQYYPYIVQYSIKAMKKMESELGYSLVLEAGYDYESIIKLVIDNIINDEFAVFTLGKLTLDSRGRAIYEIIRRIFNPIANKMARALVVTPKCKVTEDALHSAYLFIAEITEGFTPDVEKKTRLGKEAYETRKLLKLNLKTEKGIDKLFENIWLERMYKDLDAYNADNSYEVTTPLEVDFSALT